MVKQCIYHKGHDRKGGGKGQARRNSTQNWGFIEKDEKKAWNEINENYGKNSIVAGEGAIIKNN